MPFGLPFRPVAVPRDVRAVDRRRRRDASTRPSSSATATCSPARSGWNCRSCPPFAVRSSPDIVVIPPATGSADGGSAGRVPHAQVAGDVDQQPRRRDGSVVAAACRPAGGSTPASAPVEVRARGRRGDGDVRRDAGTRRGRPATTPSTATVTRAGGVTSDTGYDVVEYPHIHRRHVIEPAPARVKVIDVSDRARTCASATSWASATRCRTAIEQLGAGVDLIDAGAARVGRPVAVRRHRDRRARLRAAARPARQQSAGCSRTSESGGTVLVQLQQVRVQPGAVRAVSGEGRRPTASPTRTRRSRCWRPTIRCSPRRTGSGRRRGPAGCRSAGLYFLGERDRATSI